ncbi:ABC transporter ATP-binding protein [Streptomyces sp. NPDC020141]|uniref:ABC transporter ATP-binding protein n=1 Tax=Streptomyces sp. NPDC020141 TaxID=3365065 RepID=UPI00378BEF54
MTAHDRPVADGGVRARIGERWRLARLAGRSGWPLVAVTVVCEAAIGLLPVVFVVATGALLEHIPGAVAGDAASSARTLAMTALAVAAVAGQQALTPVQSLLGELIARRVDGQVLDRLAAAALRGPGTDVLDDQRLSELLNRAGRDVERGFQSPGKGCAGQLHLLARGAQLAGFAVTVGVAFNWFAAAGLVAVVLVFRHGQRRGLREHSRASRDNAALRRESDYLRALAMRAPAAKEIRVFGLSDWLAARYRRSSLAWLLPSWAARRRIMLRPYVHYTAFGLVLTATLLATAGAEAARTLAASGVALVVQSVMGGLRLGEYYPESDLQTEHGARGHEALLELERAVRALPLPAPAAAVPVPRLAREIRFTGVGFGYPGRDEPVFRDLDLRIEAGRCTAIVGVNGVGKTTLVKLLTRLCEPDSGTITVDGVDVGRLPVQRWRERIAVVFQDFNRYEADAADNIAFGAVAHRADTEGIRAAAARAGLLDVLDRLPGGLGTPLARHLTGGAELSGGQWQRIALARALFRLDHGADLLVMDEPTASLDVRAEARFFDEFTRATLGRTSLLISHRFSTVRHADRIIVLADGAVAEEGTHDELLALGGRYAALFLLQADSFGDRPAPDGGRADGDLDPAAAKEPAG